MPRQAKLSSEGLKDSWRVAALQSTSDVPLNWVQVSVRIVAAMTTAVSRYMKSALRQKGKPKGLQRQANRKGKHFPLNFLYMDVNRRFVFPP